MPWPRELMRRGRGGRRRRTRTMFGETSWAEHLRGIPRFRRLPQPAETVGTSRGTRAYAIKLRMTEGISAGLFRLIVQTIVLFLRSGYWESSCFQRGVGEGISLVPTGMSWFNGSLLSSFPSRWMLYRFGICGRMRCGFIYFTRKERRNFDSDFVRD